MGYAGKPTSSYRRFAPLPAQWQPREPTIVRPPVWEFILLSMLLHAIAIALFGAPSGGSSEGRAMWGALQVVLQGPPADVVEPRLKIDRGLRQLPDAAAKPVPEPARAKPEARVEPRIESPPIVDAPVEAPLVIPPLLDRIRAPDRMPELTPFRVPPPTPVQAAPPPPMAAPIVQPVPTPLPERVTTAPIVIPPVETVAVPAVPAAPPIDRAPVEVPAIESIAPRRIEPAPKPVETAPAQEVPVAPPPLAAPVQQPLQQREAPARIDRAPPVRDEPALRPSPFVAPGPDAIRNREGGPSTTYDPTAPSIDMDAMRKRAGEMARAGSGQRAILPFPMPAPPERKTKEQIAIENARKPDCRTAYAQLGLAAVVPLIANEFGEGTCRW